MVSEGAPAVNGDDTAASVGISRTLFFGLLLSIGIMVVGVVLATAQGGTAATSVVGLDRILSELARGSRSALLDAGILVLFATPLVGVGVALVEFIRQGDRAFSLIAGLLLLVLSAGFLVALH